MLYFNNHNFHVTCICYLGMALDLHALFSVFYLGVAKGVVSSPPPPPFRNFLDPVLWDEPSGKSSHSLTYILISK